MGKEGVRGAASPHAEEPLAVYGCHGGRVIFLWGSQVAYCPLDIFRLVHMNILHCLNLELFSLRGHEVRRQMRRGAEVGGLGG